MKNEYYAENITMDKDGRVIIFEIGGVTCGNFYIQSGTDASSRGKRENYFSEVIPQLLINHKQHGFVGGDLNSIVDNGTKTSDTARANCHVTSRRDCHGREATTGTSFRISLVAMENIPIRTERVSKGNGSMMSHAMGIGPSSIPIDPSSTDLLHFNTPKRSR